jgi:hypothetical protein
VAVCCCQTCSHAVATQHLPGNHTVKGSNFIEIGIFKCLSNPIAVCMAAAEVQLTRRYPSTWVTHDAEFGVMVNGHTSRSDRMHKTLLSARPSRLPKGTGKRSLAAGSTTQQLIVSWAITSESVQRLFLSEDH